MDDIYLHPQNAWEAACVAFAAKHTVDVLESLGEPDSLHLYMGYDIDEPAPKDWHQSPQTEVRLILKTLYAYLEIPQPPWGITMLGWLTYANHTSPAVRAAVARHPYRFIDYCYIPPRPQNEECKKAA